MQTYVKTHINQGHICGRPEPAVLNSPPPLCFPQSFVFARLWHQRRLSTLCPPLTVWQLAPIKYRGQSAVSRPLIYSRSAIRSRWWWTAGMSWSWTGFTGLHYGAFSCHLTYTLDFWGADKNNKVFCWLDACENAIFLIVLQKTTWYPRKRYERVKGFLRRNILTDCSGIKTNSLNKI